MRELVIDTEEVRTVGELHALLSDALGFPDHYGRNLAALEDCLGEVARRTRVTLVKCFAASPGDPADFEDPAGLTPSSSGAVPNPLDRPLTDRYLDLLAKVLLRSARENPALDVCVIDEVSDETTTVSHGEKRDDESGNEAGN